MKNSSDLIKAVLLTEKELDFQKKRINIFSGLL